MWFVVWFQGGEVVKMEGQQPSFLMQSFVLTKRSFVNMYRALGYYWLRFAIYIALCLCCGTIFYDIGHNYGSIQVPSKKSLIVLASATDHCCVNRVIENFACRLVAPCSCSSAPSSPSWPSEASHLSSRT